MGRYLEEKTALETKYSYPCKPLYKERGDFVAIRSDDEIERVHKEEGGEKEEEGLNGDNNGGNNDAGGRGEGAVRFTGGHL